MSPSKTTTLAATTRDRVGSRYAQRLRTAGKLPAVLYGHKKTPVPLAVDAGDALRHIRAGKRVFTLSVDGGGEETALLKDIQYDYLGSDVIHADFERVNLDEQVEVNLHVAFRGDAVGLKTTGAIMLHPTTELACSCRVIDVVDHIEVDVSNLENGQSLHAGEIALPPNMTLLSDPEAVVATIVVQKQIEEEVGEQAEVEGEAAEPEVISEKKEDDEGKSKEKEKEKE